MLPNMVECPRCGKSGFLTLRPVYSSHYCLIKIPYKIQKFVKKQIVNPASGKGEEPTKLVNRWRVAYGPFWHFYIGHYDAEKYKKAMEKYKKGGLKSRPNGRRWCKVRYKPVNGEAQSDLALLMAKYNFTIRDISNERDEKREDFTWKHRIF
jgi:hypothetical protein